METPLLLSQKGGNGHLLGDTLIEPIVFVTQIDIFIYKNQLFREKRVKLVELLMSVGAKTTSTPCKIPVFEIKSDPLFRSVAVISSTITPTKPFQRSSSMERLTTLNKSGAKRNPPHPHRSVLQRSEASHVVQSKANRPIGLRTATLVSTCCYWGGTSARSACLLIINNIINYSRFHMKIN